MVQYGKLTDHNGHTSFIYNYNGTIRVKFHAVNIVQQKKKCASLISPVWAQSHLFHSEKKGCKIIDTIMQYVIADSQLNGGRYYTQNMLHCAAFFSIDVSY